LLAVNQSCEAREWGRAAISDIAPYNNRARSLNPYNVKGRDRFISRKHFEYLVTVGEGWDGGSEKQSGDGKKYNDGPET